MSSDEERNFRITHDLKQIQDSRTIFTNVVKRVLKTTISKNPNTLANYRIDNIAAFNAFSTKLHNIFANGEPIVKKLVNENFEYAKEKFEAVLARLNLQSSAPIPNSVGEQINAADIPEITIHTEDFDPNTSEFLDDDNISSTTSDSDSVTETNMSTPPTTAEFLKLASATLNYKYAGDPLSLTPFIDSVELLATLATTDPLSQFLVSFIKTKIEGRAREYIDASHTTVANIIAALRSNIKPDNSKVVEGRMLALRLTNSTQDEFAKKCEELADSLRRSLIIEGMTPQKATEIAVEKTIDLCRSQAKSDIVKSILESATFASPKDVVAKLLTQNEKAKKEHNVLIFRSARNQTQYRPQASFAPRRGNFHNQMSYRNDNRNGRYYGNNTNGNGTQQSFRFNQNGRGRGRYNNNTNRNFSSTRPQNTHGSQSVRLVSREETGNSQSPRQFTLGAQETDI